jgi:uncharacterized CHY-type Zn-finger protein
MCTVLKDKINGKHRTIKSTMVSLDIPTLAQKQSAVRAFVEDLESFTVHDKKTNTLLPVICCVCDSIPSSPNWFCYVKVELAKRLFEKSNMEASKLEEFEYPPDLLKQYAIDNQELKPFVLSPASHINEKNEILMCNQCHSELTTNFEKRKTKTNTILPPIKSIANGYVIGNAPKILTDLNAVELALVSRACIYCQSWIFFGGCHQHVKGWHTIFRNDSGRNLAHLNQLTESGMEGSLLVVLCGPFTPEQKALTLKKRRLTRKK